MERRIARMQRESLTRNEGNFNGKARFENEPCGRRGTRKSLVGGMAAFRRRISKQALGEQLFQVHDLETHHEIRISNRMIQDPNTPASKKIFAKNVPTRLSSFKCRERTKVQVCIRAHDVIDKSRKANKQFFFFKRH